MKETYDKQSFEYVQFYVTDIDGNALARIRTRCRIEYETNCRLTMTGMKNIHRGIAFAKKLGHDYRLEAVVPSYMHRYDLEEKPALHCELMEEIQTAVVSPF